MNPRVAQLLTQLDRLAASPRSAAPPEAALWREADDADVADLWLALRDAPLPPAGTAGDKLLAAVLTHVAARPGAQETAAAADPAAAADVYRRLPTAGRARGPLLAWFAGGDAERLQMLVRLLTEDPPADPLAVSVGLAPLFRRGDGLVEAVFPGLWGALGGAAAAAGVVDLANHLARTGRAQVHPAAPHAERLTSLLANLAERLAAIAADPAQAGGDPASAAARVQESVALAVSLCDALALCGARAAVEPLRQVLALPHRRLRTEAAAALARLGDPAGAPALLALAAEPTARLRVLHYAEELGLAERLDPQFTHAAARAEADLALCLSQPAYFGAPPARLELIEQRTLPWPGFDRPVECCLFRFVYRGGDEEFVNLGLAGPVAHAFAADLTGLTPDDAFALFAGWSAEHEEIVERDVQGLGPAAQADVARLTRRLRDAGYDDVTPLRWGSFFGERTLTARVTRLGRPGLAVADAQGAEFLPLTPGPRPLGAEEAGCLYRGRRLLAAFRE